jgi:hypothetical protein
MAERLSDLLHDTVDPVDVPQPDAHAIVARGRSLRTRRRVGTAVAAAVVIGAVGVGGVVAGNIVDGDGRSSQVATPGKEDAQESRADAAYDDWGAWIAGDRVTIGETTLELPDVAHLAQTSEGVVARQTQRPGGSTYTLVGPDGTLRELSIPDTVGHVEGDLNAPRVAWVESLDGALEVHVWDVVADREVGVVSQPSAGTRADDDQPYVRTAQLDGDHVYFGADDGTAFEVDWVNGGATALPYLPVTVHSGIATAMDGDAWVVYDLRRHRLVRTLGAEYYNPKVSPDGTQVQLVHDNGVGVVQPAAGGPSVELEEMEGPIVWTRGGRVLSTLADRVRVCDTSGCEGKPVDVSAGSLLPADFLNLG